MPGEFEQKFNSSLENLLRDLAASRSFWILMAGVWLAKVDPVISGICVVAGLATMKYDTEKMQRNGRKT